MAARPPVGPLRPAARHHRLLRRDARGQPCPRHGADRNPAARPRRAVRRIKLRTLPALRRLRQRPPAAVGARHRERPARSPLFGRRRARPAWRRGGDDAGGRGRALPLHRAGGSHHARLRAVAPRDQRSGARRGAAGFPDSAAHDPGRGAARPRRPRSFHIDRTEQRASSSPASPRRSRSALPSPWRRPESCCSASARCSAD